MTSDHVNNTIREYRERLAAIAALRSSSASEDDIKKAEREASALKKKLPGITFQATFRQTISAKGREGVWRKQSAAVLNGLYVCDFDHVENPQDLFAQWQTSRPDLFKELILLCFVTASGRGLKVVAKADVSRGNIIDNARWLAGELGLETDEACKDASRLSFCPGKDDILFISQQLFSYENKEFEEKYGADYRNNQSAGSKISNKRAQPSASAGAPADRTVSNDKPANLATDHKQCLDTNKDGEYTYRGVRYAETSSRNLLPNVAAGHLLVAVTSSLCKLLPTYGIFVTMTRHLSLRSSPYAEVLRKSNEKEAARRSKGLLLRLQVTICSATCPSDFALHLRVLVYQPLPPELMLKMERQIRLITSTGGHVSSLSLVQVSAKQSLPLETR